MEPSLIADFVTRMWCPTSDADLTAIDLGGIWTSAAEHPETWLEGVGEATQGLGPPMLYHLRLAGEGAVPGRQPARQAVATQSPHRGAASLGAKQGTGRVGAQAAAQWCERAIHDVGHRRVSQALFGKSYSGVHRFMDRASGGYHRWVGHGLGDIAKTGWRFAGRSGTFNKKAATVAAQHLFQDFFTTRGIPLVGKQTAERLSSTFLFRALGADTAAKVSKLLALNFVRGANIIMWVWCAFDLFRMVRDIRTSKVIQAAYQDVETGNPLSGLARLERAPVVNRGWRWLKACGEIGHIIALSELARGHECRANKDLDRSIAALHEARDDCKRKETMQIPWPECPGAPQQLPRIEASARGLVGLSLMRSLRLRHQLREHSPDLAEFVDEVASDFHWRAERAWDAFLGHHVASATQNHLYAAEAYLIADQNAARGFADCIKKCTAKLSSAVHEYKISGEEEAREMWRPEARRAEALSAVARPAQPSASPSQKAKELGDLATCLDSVSPTCVSELRGWQKATEGVVRSLTQTDTAQDGDGCEDTVERHSAIARVLSVLPMQRFHLDDSDLTAWHLEAASALCVAGDLATTLDDAVGYYRRAADQFSGCHEHLHAAQLLDTALQYSCELNTPADAQSLHASRDQSLEASLAVADRTATAPALNGRAELPWYRAHVRLLQAKRSRNARRTAKAIRELVAAAEDLSHQDCCVLSRGAAGIIGSGRDAAMVAYLEALAATEAAVDDQYLSLRTGAKLRKQILTSMATALRT